MRLGKMDRRIKIQKKVLYQGTSGESKYTTETFAEVWADVMPMRVTERYESSALHSIRTSNFRIRYLDGVLPDMLLAYEGLSWRITGIAEIGRREGLDVTAEAVL